MLAAAPARAGMVMRSARSRPIHRSIITPPLVLPPRWRTYAAKSRPPSAEEILKQAQKQASQGASADGTAPPTEGAATPRPSAASTSGGATYPPKPPSAGKTAINGRQVKSGSGQAATLEERSAARDAQLPGGPMLVEDPATSPKAETTRSADGHPSLAPGAQSTVGSAAPDAGAPTTGSAEPPFASRNALSETSSSSFASQMLDLASETPPPRSDSEDQGPTGARSKTGRRSLSSIERRRQLYTRIMLGGLGVGGVIWLWSMGDPWESEREQRALGNGEEGTRASRSKARILDMFDYFNKPAWNPLLPPMLPDPHGRPYTLLVDLDDLLIHSGWTREHGWRTAKRPGVDYFLGYLSQFYEIVIFTTQPSYTAIAICEKIDPYGYYAPYKLFRESCRSRGVMQPQLLKDLDYLGRDLSKTVFIDTKPELFALQPDNGFGVPPWKGDRRDTGLVDLIPLLEAIAFNRVQDVRDVVRAYKGRDPVKAYAESEARQKKELLDKWEQDKQAHTGPRFNFGSLFGIGAPRTDEPPKLPIEKDRERAQQAYVEEQKYWKENEGSLKQLMEEDRQRQMAEMKGSLVGFLTGGMQPPKPPGSEPSSPVPAAAA